jgi:UDP-N-acetylmuramoyl-tripeptide--D-alanyl-D-alanine ligase
MWPLTGKEIYESITKVTKSGNSFDDFIIEGVCIDSRKIKPYHFFIAIEGDRFDGHVYLAECFEKGVHMALVNKDSPHLNQLSKHDREKCIEVDNVLDKFREFAKFMRQRFSFPVFGIAGSNGKTTTKEMLASLLSGGNFKVTKTEKSENGFLGMALTLCQEAHHVKSPPNALVLEIGIDDIGAMEQHVSLGMPHISLITALGPEHLEHLINWETAAAEELILFRNPNTKRIWQFSDKKVFQAFQEYIKDQELNSLNPIRTNNDYVVIEKNEFEKLLIHKEKILKNISHIIVWQPIQYSSFDSDLKFEIYPNGENQKSLENMVFKVPMPGAHNAANFALAFASATMQKRTPQEISLGWENFAPPPMRSRITSLKNGAVLFDDSYNSSPMSLEAALHSLDNKEWNRKIKFIVLGDMLDLGSESKYWHEKIFYSLKNLQNAYLCLYGSAMYDCYKLLKETEDMLILHNKTRLFWLAANEEPSQFLDSIDVNMSDFVILVKGSRGMKLDRLVKSIEEKYC